MKRLSALFLLLTELGDVEKTTPFDSYPFCWERRIGKWFIAVNGHRSARLCSRNVTVERDHCYVEWNRRAFGTWNSKGEGVGNGTTVCAVVRAELERIWSVKKRREDNGRARSQRRRN